MRAFAVLAVVAGCGRTAPAPTETEQLASYLHRIASLEPAARTKEIESWKLDRARFDRIVVVPFRAAYDGYSSHFAQHVGELATTIPAQPTVRRHFAGDPALSPSQGRLRWVLPVMYPSLVATGVDTVFVHVDGNWYALAGLDDAVLDRARALDSACGQRLAGPVTDIGWEIADAALRDDRDRFAHACKLAAMTR